MKKIAIGILLGVLLVVASGALFVAMGGMPVATAGKPLPFERLIAGISLHAALKHEEDKPAPFAADEAHLLSGVAVYRAQCAVCHSLPGQPPGPIASGLFPRPPQLFKAHHDVVGVSDDPVGETYWKVKNGIRLTGMPGFAGGLTDTEMWEVSLLLQQADKLPANVQAALH